MTTQPEQGPTPRFVYVGTYTRSPSISAGVYVFVADEEGGLRPVQTVGDIEDPSWVALDPQGKTLYVTSEVSSWNGAEAGGVVAYAVDQASGYLSRINDQPTMETGPAMSVVDPTGRFLLIANYRGGAFAVFPLGEDGRIEPASDVVPVTGHGPHGRQKATHPHDVTFDPAGGFVFGADLGTDKVWSWRLDDAGKLIPNELPFAQVDSGSGPRHVAFHPNGKAVYVINELASSLTAFRYDSVRGAMTWLGTESTLPAGFDGVNHCGEIAVHPSGAFLYGSNRGHDSVVIFPLDPDTDQLGSPSWEPTQGETPRNFAIDPSGTLLLVANQDSDSIVPFRIDSKTGGLTPAGPVTQVGRPVSIAFGSEAPAGTA